VPVTLEIRQVCELALQKIGAFSINDAAASAEELERARSWLDMVVGHMCAQRRRWWLVENTGTVTLAAGINSYVLPTALGVAADSIEFVIGAWRVQVDGPERVPFDLMRRQEWEATTRLTSGPPNQGYIDRATTPTLYVNPVPSDLSYNLDVVWQSFSPDLVSTSAATPLPKIRRAWNFALVHALAAEIGDGPIRKLPADEVKGMRDTAKRLLADLDAYEDQEHADEPRRTEYNDF
jgi:hypothetical protein